MKISSRGFTLVELMIVIAIIGILAAALFPSLTAYLKRSRDAGRAANLNTIATALGAFYSDKERYPDTAYYGCVNTGAATGLGPNYLPKGVPTDPQAGKENGCGANGLYGYGSGMLATTSPGFFLTAIFENAFGGNTGGSVALYAGSGKDFAVVPTFTKGVGSGYVLGN